MIPSVGRIVNIRLSDDCASSINKRRQDAKASSIAGTNSGAIVHSGNPAAGGDILPMIICRIFAENPTESTVVNGQIFLDGNDTYWATSVIQGTENGQWFDPRNL